MAAKYRKPAKPVDFDKEMRLFIARGNCPNRSTLISKFFYPVFDTKAKPIWICNFKFIESLKQYDILHRLPFLFMTESKKIIFLPHPSEEYSSLEEVIGYFLCIKRKEQICSELQGDELKLYPVYFEDIKHFFPIPTEKDMEKKKKYYKTKKEVRFVFGKWDKLLEKKISDNDYYTFYPSGYSRLNFQTTGRITGSWGK